MTSSGEPSPAGTPSLGAPKYGTVIPNRIFVGGIAANTTEQELKQFFSSYGAVKDTKIIADRAGVSKGRYGFVTFDTQEDAEKIIKKEGDNLIFKERKLNIGPAVRKQQPFTLPRIYEPSLSPATVMYAPNGVQYTFQKGMAFFPVPEGQGGYSIPTQPQQQTYPMMVPTGQAVYAVSQPGYAAAYQSPQAAAPAQWVAQAQWQWPGSPQTTPTQIASGATQHQYVYQTASGAIQALPSEVVYPQAAFQTELPETAMMEPTPEYGYGQYTAPLC